MLERFCWSTRLRTLAAVSMAIGACSHGPPPDLAPDPGLLGRMTALEIVPAGGSVCPGERLNVSYFAVLDDGARIPFERRYDRDNPPLLHVVMLRRTSPDAQPLEGGDWRTHRDPLSSAMTGYRLNAFLNANPSLNASAVVAPQYACTPHQFSFSGDNGRRGEAGQNGPDVTVRVGTVSTPFYDRLLLVGIEVGIAPPQYFFYEHDRIISADWLRIESRGGRGGRGVAGDAGTNGRNGATACPGTAGTPGGPGGAGGPGGSGGRGGTVTVIVPSEERLMAGLVDVVNRGGRGGRGGSGGPGGEGGEGGRGGAAQRESCGGGQDGPAGSDGSDGRSGRSGPEGPRSNIIEVPAQDVFGPRPPRVLQDVLDYTYGG